jgi:hypothetical protein
MLLFTWKTTRLIDSAVRELADDKQLYMWREWLKDNPQLRRPGGITDDQRGPPSADIVTVILSALSRLESTKKDRLADSSVSDDEISDLENDLTYIAALTKDLRESSVR